MGVPFSSSAAVPTSQATGSATAGDIGSGAAVPPTRSGALTGSAIYFYFRAVGGVLAVLSGVAATSSAGGGGDAIPIIFGLAFATPFIYGDYVAGRRLWGVDPKGRGLGMLMAGLGVAFDLYWLARGVRAPMFLFSAVLAAGVFYYLWTTDDLSR
jgi:hypothetical protein